MADEGHRDDDATTRESDEGAGGWDVATRTDSDGSSTEADNGNAAEPEEETVELERPPTSWHGDGDPTGSSTWRWLTWMTGLSALVLVFWPGVLVAFEAGSQGGLVAESVGRNAAFAFLAGALVLRFVVLPALLFVDAGKIRATEEVDWSPDRAFYALTGVVTATLTCGYYLFKRQRYTGNPSVVRSDGVLRYEDRVVQSNWHIPILLTPLSAIVVTGALEVETGLSEPFSTLLLGPILLLIAVAGFLRFVVLPFAFARDAAAVRKAPDVDWEPNGTLYALLGYVFAFPAVVIYLHRRQKRTAWSDDDLF